MRTPEKSVSLGQLHRPVDESENPNQQELGRVVYQAEDIVWVTLLALTLHEVEQTVACMA